MISTKRNAAIILIIAILLSMLAGCANDRNNYEQSGFIANPVAVDLIF